MLCLPLVSFKDDPTKPAPAKYRIKTIVLDAGHGGKDGATHGLISREKDLTLKTAISLGKAIEANMPDVKVVLTRTEDVFIPLYERMNIANDLKADLFISIHVNDMPVESHRVISSYKRDKHGKKIPVYTTVTRKATSTRGVETFVAGSARLKEQDVVLRENASILLEKDYKDNYDGYDPNDPESVIILNLLKNSFREQSIRLATAIQQEYIKTGRVDRGVQEQSLAVLRHAGMPAVLTEIGFICNPEEERYMNSEAGQNEIVTSLLNAIQAYKKQVEFE
ncbi:MAG: N-acetylmuramoyl-L-alanine amidase [Sphingobacteriaceae bacterium]|jgi:N-acetylmuramoyl-L-alanine amidase|nr:N-acetylmuramoyl-L-alanine amidase [Sphingobacteriaceae bacterium]